MVEAAGENPFRALEELEGATLADRFLVRTMIGRGGYGAVFVGEQVSMGRTCAIKVLIPHLVQNRTNVKRFEVEARATSTLAHPNTIVTYDFGFDDARQLLFMAMEHIDGFSLRELMTRRRRIDLPTASHIATQIAGSLQDAHDRGLVHRDVKPGNVMITKRGGDENFVKVIDFGIAKFLDTESIKATMRQVTASGTVLGTPSYMAPEQVRGLELDGRTDQYALAICLYEMLTGQQPFTAKSPMDVAVMQLTERPQPPSAVCPGLPQGVDVAILRALEKDREHRFGSVTEFTEAFAAAVGSGLSTQDPYDAETEPMQMMSIPAPMATQPTMPMPSEAATQPPVDRHQVVRAQPVAPVKHAAPRAATALIIIVIVIVAVVALVLVFA